MRPAGHEANEDSIKALVSIVKDHPAVFCYMVMDEPFSHASSFGGEEAMEDYLRNSYKIIREIDDKHPVYLCEDQKRMYPTSVKYVDLLGIDPYPGNGDFGRHVADMTLAAAEATRGEKPVAAVTQSMSWKGVIPDGPMLRTQLYQAMMAGAQCVGYYPWVPDNEEIDVNLNVSRYWDTMLSFNEYDKSLLYSYYARGEYDEFKSYKDNDLWYDIFTNNGVYYMTVLNRKSEQASVTLSLENAAGKAIPQGYEMSVVNGGDIQNAVREGNTVTVTLDPYGAVLYKFAPQLPEKDIVFIDENGNVLSDASQAEGEVYLCANGFKSGERLYMAKYTQYYGTQRLSGVVAETIQVDGTAVCRVDLTNDENITVKAFVWTENMGTVYVKEL